MRIWIAMMLLPALALSACGGAQSRKDGEGQLTVAHYVAPDGTKGLVLDRTGGQFKVRMDGDDAIIELTPVEDRDGYGGEVRGHFLFTPDDVRMLYVSARGGLTLFTESGELHLSSDKGARPLGAATQPGPPRGETRPYQILNDELAAISVRQKNPKLTSADSSNLAVVAEALRAADASMLVRYRARKGNSSPSIRWTPSSIDGIGFGGGSHRSDEKWEKKGSGLAKYGAVIKGYSEPDSRGNHLFVQTMEGYPPPLADNTPGLVWEVDSTTVTFVTLDGARYDIDCGDSAVENGAPIEKGAGAPSGWPAPLQHSLVGITEVTALAKAGAVPAERGGELIAIDDEWNACAQKVWKRAKNDIDRLKAANIDWSARSGRTELLLEKWSETVRKDCRGASSKLERSLLQFIEARNKERLALFETAKARFGK